MANEEHLKILKQGVGMWNRWRKEHPEIQPDLARADIRDTELSYGGLDHACVWAANLREAELSYINFSGAYLKKAACYKANLAYSNLSLANLIEADLSDANLSHAQLSGADLRHSNLHNADFSYAIVGETIFGDNDLSCVKGLDSVIHRGPSNIGVDTIYRSNGNIPEVFLRGVGVPDSFITYARSLANQAIDFYSCFISYSSKDMAFAERLYADLQTMAVRCWFAPEDLKTGDKFRQRIDESIRMHDKLLLILSVHSISSIWVEEEVERAIEREHIENRLVLFPIRIDDSIMTNEKAWVASLRRMRHIGNFTAWKNHDTYKKAFDRLLRDLKTEDIAKGRA